MSITRKDLNRNWKWKVDGNLSENIEDSICIEIEQKIDDIIENPEHVDREAISFMCLFYLHDQSLVPWISREQIRKVKSFIDKTPKDHESLIIHELQYTLDDIKALKLSNNITATGHKLSTRLHIQGKLMGRGYTQTINNCSIFKQRHLVILGYINYLVANFSIPKNWRIILPIILIFLDDVDVMVKREACLILLSICDKDPEIIKQSQTSALFEEAIQPILLSLPTLTPSEKSVLVVPIGYKLLFKLLRISNDKDPLERYSKLSKLLKKFLLPSIGKCKDYPPVFERLLDVLDEFMAECEKFSTVLMKEPIFTLLSILIDPFLVNQPKIVIQILNLLISWFQKMNDDQMLQYVYDVLGCVGVLNRRMHDDIDVRTNIETITDIFKSAL